MSVRCSLISVGRIGPLVWKLISFNFYLGGKPLDLRAKDTADESRPNSSELLNQFSLHLYYMPIVDIEACIQE